MSLRYEPGASAPSPPDVAPGQRLVGSLRRRPRLRGGLIQLSYLAGGAAAGVVAAEIRAGPKVDAGEMVGLLFAVGGGIISLVAVVFSLLFLTIQFASTTLSPRLNLFRDAPLVWHAFGLFVGVFVFTTTAALRASVRGEMSVVVPAATIVLALAAMAVARNLQLSAYQSLQIGPTVQEITRRGRAVIDQQYEHRTAERRASPRENRLRPDLRSAGGVTTDTSAKSTSNASCVPLSSSTRPSSSPAVPGSTSATATSSCGTASTRRAPTKAT